MIVLSENNVCSCTLFNPKKLQIEARRPPTIFVLFSQSIPAHGMDKKEQTTTH